MQAPDYINSISAISKSEFFEAFVKKSRPIIIKHLVDHWPAMQAWSAEYFTENFAGSEIGMMDIVNGSSDLHSYKTLPAREIDKKKAVASPVDFFNKKIKKDYWVPEYCANGKVLNSRIFIAPKNSSTALHRDIPENILVLVKGRKKIILFSPKTHLYPNSIFSKHPNFSKIKLEKPDYKKFPKLHHAKPFVAEINAGDTLFIPSMWWHYVVNEEDSIAINFWWSRGWQIPLSWAAARYKKIIGV